jgi:hypothetical protein
VKLFSSLQIIVTLFLSMSSVVYSNDKKCPPVYQHNKHGHKDYKVLFNHDVMWPHSKLGKNSDGKTLTDAEQVQHHVDLVADANCDVLMLCANSLYQIPAWDSDHYPFWRKDFHTREFKGMGCSGYKRVGKLILGGFDVIQIAQDRARERGIAFFLSWRMNECHWIEIEDSDTASRFWREHPEYRIGGPTAPLLPRGSKGSSIYRKLLSLCFLHKPVRDYQFGFIDELCTRYDIDGLELDFLRWPYFFPDEMSFEEKAPIMTAFIRRVREMLDRRQGKHIPICARVANRLDFVRDMGLDLRACINEGLIDMVNVASCFITQPDGDIEAFRKTFPKTPLHAEICHCISAGRDGRRIMTREMFHATAHSFLERGVDGISLFNLPYARPRGQLWPDYEPIRHITDREFLATRPKHYFVGWNRMAKEVYGKQLPVELDGNQPVTLRIHVADTRPAQTFSRSILRLKSKADTTSRKIAALCRDVCLSKTIHEGELFPTPYDGGIPETHAVYKDYVVPLNLLKKGWNTFEFHLKDSGKAVTLMRMELALYL